MLLYVNVSEHWMNEWSVLGTKGSKYNRQYSVTKKETGFRERQDYKFLVQPIPDFRYSGKQKNKINKIN